MVDSGAAEHVLCNILMHLHDVVDAAGPQTKRGSTLIPLFVSARSPNMGWNARAFPRRRHWFRAARLQLRSRRTYGRLAFLS